MSDETLITCEKHGQSFFPSAKCYACEEQRLLDESPFVLYILKKTSQRGLWWTEAMQNAEKTPLAGLIPIYLQDPAVRGAIVIKAVEVKRLGYNGYNGIPNLPAPDDCK